MDETLVLRQMHGNKLIWAAANAFALSVK